MSATQARRQQREVTVSWRSIMPGGLAVKYRLLTGTDTVMEGLRKLCESGLILYANAAVEFLFARNNLLLVPPTSEPLACIVRETGDMESLSSHEFTDAYAIGFLVHSLTSGGKEFSCVVFDQSTGTVRPCTIGEARELYTILEGETG